MIKVRNYFKQKTLKIFVIVLTTSLIILLPQKFVKADGDDSKTKYTNSGYIHDKETGENLIGATIFVKELKTGTSSNVYGFYSISLEPGTYTLIFSYIGYESHEKTFNLNSNITYNVNLAVKKQELEEVVITGTALNENITRAEMSIIKMDVKLYKGDIPAPRHFSLQEKRFLVFVFYGNIPSL